MSVATECAMPVPTAASTAFPADEVLSSAPQEATVPEMWEQLQEVEVLPLKEGLQTPTSACTDIELAFSRPQFNDVLRSHFAPSGEYDLDGDLADYIWHLTSGHPSSVRAVLDGIASALRYRKRAATISVDDLLDFLANDGALIGCFKNNVCRPACL